MDGDGAICANGRARFPKDDPHNTAQEAANAAGDWFRKLAIQLMTATER